jgi:hypothetical protein
MFRLKVYEDDKTTIAQTVNLSDIKFQSVDTPGLIIDARRLLDNLLDHVKYDQSYLAEYVLLLVRAYMFDSSWCKGTPFVLEHGSKNDVWLSIYKENM